MERTYRIRQRTIIDFRGRVPSDPMKVHAPGAAPPAIQGSQQRAEVHDRKLIECS
jgi:hypothetical protein